jgi:hypothetical protein
MKRFFINTSILSALILFSIFVILKIVSPIIRNNNDYVGESIDKEKRLATLNAAHRIIFVGGSNLAFGMNSKLIQDSTNFAVVNMGLHAGLGSDFMLSEVADGVKKGDIVLLSIEYNLDDRPDLKLLTQTLDLNQNAKRYIKLSFNEQLAYSVYDIQRCLTSSIKKLGKKFSNNIYLRNGFTKEGDLTTYLNMENIPFLIAKMNLASYSNRINNINKLAAICASRGAKIYFMFPTCQRSTYLANTNFIKQYAAIFHKGLNCPILGNTETFVYDDNNYFNSEYHLNKSGRQLRSQDIVKLLNYTKILPAQ